MKPERVHPLNESHVDFAIERAGGTRAHLDAATRKQRSADYRVGSSVIELKMLEEEGFHKHARQQKLANLFRKHYPTRPVIVLDRSLLPADDQAFFDRIVEGPIKTAITKANKQLKQSRIEHPETTCSVLLIVNNGYTTLNHEVLKGLVAHRVHQDTSEIDAVVVAGAYYHSDSLDSFFLWPMEYVPINVNRPFREFEDLRKGWLDLANEFMTEMVRGQLRAEKEWAPVIDTQFEVDDVTFIRPAPAIGGASDFYVNGRPRKDSAELSQCPPVATVFPHLTPDQWSLLNARFGAPSLLMGSYEAWRAEQAAAAAASRPLMPLVTVPINITDWEMWCREKRVIASPNSIFDFALQRFSNDVRTCALGARERRDTGVRPSRYVYVVTEIIGQDKANDISHIALVWERPGAEPAIESIVEDARIRHEHALVLAGAYAIRERLETVMWSKDSAYAWI